MFIKVKLQLIWTTFEFLGQQEIKTRFKPIKVLGCNLQMMIKPSNGDITMIIYIHTLKVIQFYHNKRFIVIDRYNAWIPSKTTTITTVYRVKWKGWGQE